MLKQGCLTICLFFKIDAPMEESGFAIGVPGNPEHATNGIIPGISWIRIL
ncbi:MAG: hypothetical protein KAI44_07030 [Methylococcales bacterium]|nr:hypothetical protein [Methylococcales bacterium]